MSDLWGRDSIQFPRLLCEIMATQDNLDISALAVSMDLTAEQVNGLFDRAHTAWEGIKETPISRLDQSLTLAARDAYWVVIDHLELRGWDAYAFFRGDHEDELNEELARGESKDDLLYWQGYLRGLAYAGETTPASLYESVMASLPQEE